MPALIQKIAETSVICFFVKMKIEDFLGRVGVQYHSPVCMQLSGGINDDLVLFGRSRRRGKCTFLGATTAVQWFFRPTRHAHDNFAFVAYG